MTDAVLERVRRIFSGMSGQTINDPHLKESAVLLLLYPGASGYCVLFNKRTEVVEHNKGEICFPGGAKDPEDGDLRATALRENQEEMGIQPQDVTIFGELDETATAAGFVIHPFVGAIPSPYPFTMSVEEVAEVLEVPISTLMAPESVREEVRIEPDGQVVKEYSYAYKRHLIYGATARILRQFLELVEGADGLREALKA